MDLNNLNSLANLYGVDLSFSISSLIAGILFGIIGWYFFRHGRKSTHAPSLIIGIIMMVYPYFISNTYWVWTIGIGLTMIAYKLAKSVD